MYKYFGMCFLETLAKLCKGSEDAHTYGIHSFSLQNKTRPTNFKFIVKLIVTSPLYSYLVQQRTSKNSDTYGLNHSFSLQKIS